MGNGQNDPQPIVHRAAQHTTLSDLTSALDRWRGRTDYDATRPILCDLTAANVRWILTECNLVGGAVRDWVNQNFERGRIALVTATATEAALLSASIDGLHWNIDLGFFHDHAVARRWLLA